MIKSLQQAKRFLTILFGFTLLVLGIAMLALPGPGMLTILLGLGILAAEYVWARRLLDRLKQQGDRIRNSIFQRDKSPASAKVSSESADPVPPTESAEVPADSFAATASKPVPVETSLTVEPLDEVSTTER
jgi:Putative transmembrane protein (PGPGW)